MVMICYFFRFVSQGSDFAKALGLCSVQFCGTVKSALLPQLSPHLAAPRPPTCSHGADQIEVSATIAAGEQTTVVSVDYLIWKVFLTW